MLPGHQENIQEHQTVPVPFSKVKVTNSRDHIKKINFNEYMYPYDADNRSANNICFSKNNVQNDPKNYCGL